MPIQLVVFDVAGTTVSDGGAVAACLLGTLEEVGVHASRDALERAMGLAKPDALAALLASARGAPADAEEVRRLVGRFEDRMVHHWATSTGVAPIDGAEACFAQLRRRGVNVALDTGFGRRVLAALLLRLGWSVPRTVDVVVTSDDVDRGRPHPDMIERAMTLLGVVDPARVVKVGDTLADLGEGHAARCGLVVGVATGTCTRETLERDPDVRVIAGVGELVPLLDALGLLPPPVRAVA